VTLLSLRTRRRRAGRLANGFRSDRLRRELFASIIVCTFGNESFRSSPTRNIRLFESSNVLSRFSSGKFCEKHAKANKEGSQCMHT